MPALHENSSMKIARLRSGMNLKLYQFSWKTIIVITLVQMLVHSYMHKHLHRW